MTWFASPTPVAVARAVQWGRSRGEECNHGGAVRGVRAAGVADGSGRDSRPGRAVRGDDRRRQGGRCRSGLGLDLGLRPLPHRARAEAGDDLRVLDRSPPRWRATPAGCNIGQMVGCNGYRNPALYAKIASTVDVASHGRLYAGIGAGWYEHEWRAYGYGLPETPERMAHVPGSGRDHPQDVDRGLPDASRASTTPSTGRSTSRRECENRTRRSGSAAAARR